MKKRILSLLLVAVMLLGLLPTVALAAETGDNTPTTDEKRVTVVEHEKEDDPIHIKKSVSDDGDMLTLEAYVTNPLKIVTDTVPLDIALVLDVSGSMGDPIGTANYIPVYELQTTGRENRYYYKNTDGDYERVYYCSGQYEYDWHEKHDAGWFTSEYYYHDSAYQLTPKTSADDPTGTQFYRYAGTDKTSKIAILKTAVNDFIDSVADISSNSNIALVKFAGDTKKEAGNDKYNNYWDINYTQIVQGLTKVDNETNVNALKNAVTNLDPDGMTRTDLGMDKAEEALKDAKNQKVVIVFTDGVPTYESDYSKDVAAKAVNKAKTLKENKTLIYTIAVAKNANPVDTTEKNINRFLHAVSSNYPGAYANEYNNIALGDRAQNSNYYRVATTGDELINIFKQLSKEVSTLTLEMDATTTLSDTLSGYFTFANTTDGYNGIKVYTADAKTEQKELEWKAPVEVQNPQINVNAKDKTITVHGFSYQANAVTISPEGNVTGGKKLIVTIPIMPDTACTDWEVDRRFYPTNSTAEGSKAGLSNYTDENGHDLTTELNESPNAPVPVYTVTYESTGANSADGKPASPADPEDDRTKAGKGYIPGQTVTVKPALKADGWEFDGWSALGISFTVKDGTKTFTMPNHNVTLTGTWTKTPTTAHVTINKTFVGEHVPEGFRLVLKKADNTVVNLEELQNPNYAYSGYAKLEKGTYTLTEVNAAIDGKKHTATLTKTILPLDTPTAVTPNPDGCSWTFEIKEADINYELVYNLTNTYTDYTPAEVNLSALIQKHLEFTMGQLDNMESAQRTFTVKLTPGTVGTTGLYTPEQDATPITGTVCIPTTANSPQGFGDFTEGDTALKDGGKLVFTGEQTKYYLVEEVIPTSTVLGMDYDSSKYVLKIDVTKNVEQHCYTAATSIYEYDEEYGGCELDPSDEETIIFRNSYTEPNSTATKNVITSKFVIPDPIADEIEEENVSFPKKVGTTTELVVDKSVDKVTLVYKVTVTGTKDAEATVSDKGATYIYAAISRSNGAWVEPGENEVKITFKTDATVTLYYTKTFTRGEDFPGTVSNTAIVNGNKVPSEETTIKDKTLGGLDFSDIIWKDLYVTGDQNFPESLTFEANLTLIEYSQQRPNSALGQIAVQSLTEDDPKEKDDSDTVVEAFPEGWNDTLYATFYPDAVTFDEHNTKRFTTKNGSHLYLEFPEWGQYIFQVEESDGKVDGVKYDSRVYQIVVLVLPTNDGLEARVNSIAEIIDDDEDWFEDENQPITFYNEVDTGEIPYYPIIPIIAKDNGKLNKTDHFAYIIGYPDGTVHPNGEITRAEVATIFFRLLKDEVRDGYFTSYNTYSDVQLGKWYNNPISTMSALGIINGYPDGTFRPNAPITRAEFAAIAARFDETATRGTATFTDIYGHWAADEIATAYGNDWIKGYPDGTFRPDRNITRAEAMTLINRVLERGPESPSDLLPDMNKWSDNMDTTKWYYLDIQEATNSHDYIRKTFDYELWKRMLLDPDWSRYER